jgi:hypothetical protein
MNLNSVNEFASTSSLQSRIQYFLVKSAVAISAEDPLTLARKKLAAVILENRLSLKIVTLMVLSDPVIAAMEDPTTVSDVNLESAVNSLIPALLLTVS